MPGPYLSPGVYVEEVPSLTQAIAGTSTNVVGFIGIVDSEVHYPAFLADDEYQRLLKAEQDKIYGKDEDWSRAAVAARLAKANAALAPAKAAVAAIDDKLKPAGPLGKALLDAQAAQDALPQTATPAEKAAAKRAVASAQTDITDAQTKRAEADKAAQDADAAVAQLGDLLKGFDNDGITDAERLVRARRSARDAARANVPRYEDKTFTVDAPIAQAKLCTNFAEFQARFGPWSSYPASDVASGSGDSIQLSGHQILSHAVYAFFNNGGRRCFVARVSEANRDGDLARALAAFESVESISLVAFPGQSSDIGVSDALVAHCESTRYRFAILDAPADPVDAQGVLDLQQLTYDIEPPLLPKRTKHAAVYFPYVEVVDPALQLQQSGLESIPSKYRGLVFIPPSGAIAGIYARTDTQRGVFKAPANASVLGAQNVKYYISRNAQDGLNPQGVNCIRTLNGDISVWGARTCGGDENGEWRYVNVRRTYLYLAKSIDEGTQWVVFEPNDATLWGKVRRNLTAFLTTAWRDGALFGATPEEAFYVKCDAENNPPETREIGQLIVEVGVSIVKPAEFMIIRISQFSGKPQS